MRLTMPLLAGSQTKGLDTMSKLYGTIDGAGKTQATRRGHNALITYAACWQGAIRVELSCDAKGVTTYEVTLQPWQGSGGSTRVLASGVLDATKD